MSNPRSDYTAYQSTKGWFFKEGGSPIGPFKTMAAAQRAARNTVKKLDTAALLDIVKLLGQ